MKWVGMLALLGLAVAQDTPKKKKAEAAFTDTFVEEESDFVSTGRNPNFVLEPGYVLVLEGGKTKQVVTVPNETKKVGNVETHIIEERETEDGELKEISRNYFVISKRSGSVYYFGEDVDEYKGGKVIGHPGTWLHGVNGAKYGLMIPGTPLLGGRHYPEVAPGVALDRAEVVSLSETFECPAGTFKTCLKTEETTPLEPGTAYKTYAPGIGLVTDGELKLVSYGAAKK